MTHNFRHCIYCGKLCGDAWTCVEHAPLRRVDDWSPPASASYNERYKMARAAGFSVEEAQRRKFWTDPLSPASFYPERKR